MRTKKKKKPVSIILLLWILIVIALLLNILILGIFNKFINDYDVKSNNLANIERGLNSFRREAENYYKNEITNFTSQLDINVVNVDISEFIHKKLPEFSSYQIIFDNNELKPLLKNLLDLSKDIDSLNDKIHAWRNNYSPIYEDIKENKSLNKVRHIIKDLSNSLLLVEGKHKLQEAKQLRKIKLATDEDEAAKLSSQYIQNFKSSSNIDINSFRNELNDLSLFIEHLNSEKNLYDLPDLRDNKIKQSLERIQRTISKQNKSKKESPLTSDSINELSRLIFGDNYYLDKKHQTIIEGEGGYFALRKHYLELIIERNNLNELLEEIKKNFEAILQKLNESIYIIRQSIGIDQKILFSNLWDKILLLSLIFLSVFILISLYVAFLVKKQIKKEQKTRNEINSILEGTGDAMRVVDTNFNIIRVNTNMSSLTGISADDSIRKKCYDLFPGNRCHSDKCSIKLVMEKNKTVQIEATKKDKDGNEIPFDIIAAPLKEKGRIISIVESFRDISDYKRLQQKIENNNKKLIKNEQILNNMLSDLHKSHIELKETQQQLIKSEKMASVGQLSAGVAHEINNPTGFVLNNLYVLTENINTLFKAITKTEELINQYFPKSDNNKVFYDDLKDIIDNDKIQFLKKDLPLLVRQSIDGAERIKKIVNNLKNFAHPGKEAKKPTNVNEEIEKALSLIDNEIKYNCVVEKFFQEVPMVNANSQQLEQVFINIIINASQSMEDKGLITIYTYFSNSSVIIEISDNGKGIPEDEIKNIFNPFFTTKEVGKGTGLGLSIVYGIIENHGGTIEVKSKLGEGTKFIISLPASK